MIPKPNKEDYNNCRSYRPITLESVVGKLFERVIKTRLTWKLESEGSIANTQYAYRKQKSCTQTVLRIVNSISEAEKEKKQPVLVMMDYESCYERIWRAGLLKKAYDKGVKGRLWVYLDNFLNGRRSDIRVNDFISEEKVSTVVIPQGSVISPILCNLYTSDSMEVLVSKHAGFADDASIWKASENVDESIKVVNKDMELIDGWCKAFNMAIAPEKTQAIIFKKKNLHMTSTDIVPSGQKVETVSQKKLLVVVVDKDLTFDQHVRAKTKSAFSALQTIDRFLRDEKGCSQSTYMKLRRSLVLPIIDYGEAAMVNSTDACVKEFSKVQQSAMIKASGCLPSTSNEALEVLTNTIPIDLHIKLRQAQELVRIHSKHEDDPLKQEMMSWLNDPGTQSRGSTAIQLLMSRFNELREEIILDDVEKEFKYSKDMMGLTRQLTVGVSEEEFKNEKSAQVDVTIQLLQEIPKEDVLAFTDGSTLNNPGPTGAGTAIFMEGYDKDPILQHWAVSKCSNNYAGEIVGIEMALRFLSECPGVSKKTIHIFSDCQSALETAFNAKIPTQKIETIVQIRESLVDLAGKGNRVVPHWVPGHKKIKGNELADKEAKRGARLAETDNIEYNMKRDKREITKAMKKKAVKKWNVRYNLADSKGSIHEVIDEAGVRRCFGEKDRKSFSIVNQLIAGQPRLKHHLARLQIVEDSRCEHCGEEETSEHFLFACTQYVNERNNLERRVEEILVREGISVPIIDLRTLAGEVEGLTTEGKGDIVMALCEYIKCSRRF